MAQPATLATRQWTVIGVSIEGTLAIIAVTEGHGGSVVHLGVTPVAGPMGLTIWPMPWTSYTYGNDIAEAMASAHEAHDRWVSEAGPIGDTGTVSAEVMRPRSVTRTHAKPRTIEAQAVEVQANDKPRRSWFRWPWGRK